VAVNRLEEIKVLRRPLFPFLGIILKGFRGVPTALPLVTRFALMERQSKRGDDQMRVMKAFLPVLLVLAFASAAEAQAQVKFGFINSQVILEQDSSAQAAQRQFESDLARYQAEISQLGEEGQQLLAQYQQQQAMLSTEARANREEEIRIKQEQYNQRVTELDQQAGVRRAELLQPVMDRINAVIEAFRAEGGYVAIFDLTGPSVIASDPALDLTQQVLTRLQATPVR
jgi:outer membrane protein